jgi:hypothetical protein
MTPKEKAKELFIKYFNQLLSFNQAKQCALIAVEEILNLKDIDEEYSFYVEVKQEILKL